MERYIKIILEVKGKTHCPVCRDGPSLERKIQELDEKIRMCSQNTREQALLQDQLNALVKQQKKYNDHLHKLESDRRYIKRIEEKCRTDPTRAMTYRDFVSWYAPNGNKVRCCVFVVISGEKPLYVFNLQWDKVNGKSDAHAYRAALKHLLTTSILDNVTKLYICGDHGPHFIGRKAVSFESQAYKLVSEWNTRRGTLLVLKCHFLPAYHAFNVCDGAGMFLKYSCVKYWRMNTNTMWPWNGHEIVGMIDKGMMGGWVEFSNPHNMVGYVFEEIDRRDAFVCPEVIGDEGSGKDKQNMPDLHNIASLKFSWKQDGVEKREPGVALFRNMMGKGDGRHEHKWHFFDTYHSGRHPRTAALNREESDRLGYPVWGAVKARSSNLVITPADRTQPPRGSNSLSKDVVPSKQAIMDMLGQRGLARTGNKRTLMQRLEEAESKDNEHTGESDGDDEMAEVEEELVPPESNKHPRLQRSGDRYKTVFDQPPDDECIPSCLKLMSWVYVAFPVDGVCRGLVIKVPRKSGKKGATTGKYDVCFNEKGQAEAYAFTAPFLRFTRAEAEEDLREAEHDEDEERDEEGDQPDASSDKSD